MGLSSICSRLLFGLAIIFVAFKGFYNIDQNKGFVSQNLRLISEKLREINIMNVDFTQYRKYCSLIVLIENHLLLLSALFTIIGIGIGKCFAFCAILLDLLLVHNPYFYDEPIIRLMSCEFLALFGAIWNCY